MPAGRRLLVCAIATVLLGSCGQSHPVDCDEGDGPYGFSRCILHGQLSPEQEEAYCAWEISMTDPEPDEIECETYLIRHRDYESCLADERAVPERCAENIGYREGCIRLLVEEPCNREGLLDCMPSPDCYRP